jgi:hypothetical protein
VSGARLRIVYGLSSWHIVRVTDNEKSQRSSGITEKFHNGIPCMYQPKLEYKSPKKERFRLFFYAIVPDNVPGVKQC